MAVVDGLAFAFSLSIDVSRKLSIAGEEEYSRKDQIHYHNEQDRHHHRSGCGAAHLLRPCPGRESFQTSHRRDRGAEHHTLQQSRSNVPQVERLDGCLNVTPEGEIRLSDAEQRSA